ncbi:hypothetical protein POL68_29205 [Stigmatella sp. ncwal1]|uniref:Uncharacterized protein n=1 Tax=Stigmatella ashevillensis TaxID=2995309 RepID=A0ABT5DJQ3_9BACT|nr:hypothetical protein [Stigmatella ashevillena]MDC0712577.1 hypothetical protein [Stigmatella ashevillena]
MTATPQGTATVSSSLMYNYLAATSMDAASPLVSAEDVAGNPILFTAGAAETEGAGKTLWVMLRDAKVPAGWRRLAVTPDAARDVKAYAVAQAPQGDVVLVAAVDDGAGGSRIFVSPRITPVADGSTWDALNSQWVERTGAPPGQPIQRLVMGDYPDASQPPLLIAEVASNTGTITRYFVDASTASMTSAFSLWSPPEDVRTTHDVVVAKLSMSGHVYQGTWTLYDNTSGSLHLMFTSLLDENMRSHTLSVSPPAGARCLAALPDANNKGISNLFVGGDSLSFFPSATLTGLTSKAQPISTGVTAVKAVLACQDGERVAVWAVDSSGNLFYTSNVQGAPTGWSSPTVMRQHVAQIAPRRNTRRCANELFLTTSDNSTIAYLWQDPDTTSWQNSDMALPALSATQEFACYTTVARFTSAQGAPIVGAEVRINASEWTWALANGYWMALDSDGSHPVTLKTDSQGSVTIINKVSDLGTPVFRFNADFLSSEVLADPSTEVRASLSSKLAGADLSSWQRADGTPIIPPGTDPTRVTQLQDSLRQLLSAADSLPQDGSPASGDSSPSTAAVAGGSNARLSRTVSFGVISDVTNAIETAAGDVLQALEAAGQALYNYVIEPIVEGATSLLKFFVQIGEQVLTFVIRTISEVMQLVSWLFQQLALVIEDLIELIGFLFSWDDILDTHTVLREASLKGLRALSSKLSGAGPQIEAFFNELIAQLPALASSSAIAQSGDTNLATLPGQSPEAARSQSFETQAAFMSSPGGSFASYQLAHGGILQADPIPGGDIAQAIIDFMNTVITAVKDVGAGIQALVEGVVDLYKAGQLTLSNLATLLLTDAAATILATIRDVLTGACAVMGDLISVAEDTLTKVINIPLLSGLYRWVTDGSDPTVLDALALLLAIPSTIFYKLLRGSAPFPGGQLPSFLALPETFSPLVLAVDTSSSLDQDEGFITYSQVGGIVNLIASGGILLAAPTALIAAESKADRVAAGASAIEAALYTLGWATAFPTDNARLQQGFDRGKWVLDALCALTACTSATLAGGAIFKPSLGPAAIAAGNCGACLGLIDGVYGIISSVTSYILELVVLTGDDVPNYHGFWKDSTKLVSNLAVNIGTATEAAGSISYQDELLVVTVVGYGLYFVLTTARAAYQIGQAELYQAY